MVTRMRMVTRMTRIAIPLVAHCPEEARVPPFLTVEEAKFPQIEIQIKKIPLLRNPLSNRLSRTH
jgi:hypothetical protein